MSMYDIYIAYLEFTMVCSTAHLDHFCLPAGPPSPSSPHPPSTSDERATFPSHPQTSNMVAIVPFLSALYEGWFKPNRSSQFWFVFVKVQTVPPPFSYHALGLFPLSPQSSTKICIKLQKKMIFNSMFVTEKGWNWLYMNLGNILVLWVKLELYIHVLLHK